MSNTIKLNDCGDMPLGDLLQTLTTSDADVSTLILDVDNEGKVEVSFETK